MGCDSRKVASIAKPSPSFVSPPATSCSEGFVIPHKVSGQTLTVSCNKPCRPRRSFLHLVSHYQRRWLTRWSYSTVTVGSSAGLASWHHPAGQSARLPHSPPSRRSYGHESPRGDPASVHHGERTSADLGPTRVPCGTDPARRPLA